MISLNLVTDRTRFQCQRCTKCCSLDVMLSEREMAELGPCVDRAWRTTRKIRRGSRFICCLLKGADCSVYARRPLLCRLYPFFAVPLEQLKLLGNRSRKGHWRLAGAMATPITSSTTTAVRAWGKENQWSLRTSLK